MKSSSLYTRTLPLIITALALIDGVLHLSLDAILFRGNYVGPLTPPPGAPPGGFPPLPVPMPLQLNQMFVANFLTYVLLVVLFWAMLRSAGRQRSWVDVPLLIMAVVSILAWVDFGRPNPMGLGYLSKAIEVLLIVALIAHARLAARDRQLLHSRTEARVRPV